MLITPGINDYSPNYSSTTNSTISINSSSAISTTPMTRTSFASSSDCFRSLKDDESIPESINDSFSAILDESNVSSIESSVKVSKKRKKSGNDDDERADVKKSKKESSSKHRHSSGTAGHHSGSHHGHSGSLVTIKEEKVDKAVIKLKEKKKTKEWICPKCKKPDQTDSIMCDRCQLWFHFTCVGIIMAPKDDENWYCNFCRKKVAKSGHK